MPTLSPPPQPPSPSPTLPLRLITLNIRYATAHPVPGEAPWPTRCPKLSAQLTFLTSTHASPFICLQEVLHHQLTDIHARLGPSSWGYIGRGRTDGKQAGEYSPIFYRADRWECEHSRTCWLSETPGVPSRGWDADLERVVTMGCFRDRGGTGVRVVVMSTHFDHRGVVAREESARMVLGFARSWPEGKGEGDAAPVFIGGDFNSTPDGAAYKVLTAEGSGVRDIADLVPEDVRYGNKEITYTSFGEPDEKPGRIDFLFVRGAENLRFRSYGIPPNRFDDGVFLSDHRPVVADVEVPVQAAM